MPRVIIAALLVSLAACKDGPPGPAPATAAKLELRPAVNIAVNHALSPAVDPNEELATRIRRALEDTGKIDAAGIDIVASGGVVSLWGTTASRAELERASELARTVHGVKSVDNRLVVVRGS
jgi:hypothetical protein